MGHPAGSSPQDGGALSMRLSLSSSPKQRKEKVAWKPDGSTSKCQSCRARFGVFHRRHHCRRCGNIFCSKCSSERTILHPRFGYGPQPQRQCRFCSRVDEHLWTMLRDELWERFSIATEANADFMGLHCESSKSANRILEEKANELAKAASHQRKPTFQDPSDSSNGSASKLTPLLTIFSDKSGQQQGTRAQNAPLSRRSQTPPVAAASPAPKLHQLLEDPCDPVLLRAALFFVDRVSSSCSAQAVGNPLPLLRDRRVGLKSFKNLFAMDETLQWLHQKYPSVDGNLVLECFRRANLFEAVDGPASAKLFRFDDDVVSAIRKEVAGGDVEPLAIGIGSVVLRNSELAVGEEVEGCVVAETGEGEAEVVYSDNATETIPKDSLSPSLFQPLTVHTIRGLCGRLRDLSGDACSLLDVRPDFLRIASAFVQHVSLSLANDPPKGVARDAFEGPLAVEWFRSVANLSEVDAVDFCEVLRRCGLFSLVPETQAVFSGTAGQYFRLTPYAAESLDDALSEITLPPALRCRASGKDGPVLGHIVTGKTVLVTACCKHRYKEGYVVDELARSGQTYLRLQLSEGDAWTCPEYHAVTSPATEVIAMRARPDLSLDEPSVQALAYLFACDRFKFVKEGGFFTKYRNAFLADDAVAWLEKSFPSLSTSDAYDAGDVLRRAGLFAHANEDGHNVAFEKRETYKFNDAVVASLL
eukprot:gene2577-3994_t